MKQKEYGQKQYKQTKHTQAYHIIREDNTGKKLICKKKRSNSKPITRNPNHEYIENQESITRDLCNKYIEEIRQKEMPDRKRKYFKRKNSEKLCTLLCKPHCEYY